MLKRRAREFLGYLAKKLSWLEISLFFRLHWTVVVLIGVLTTIVWYWARTVFPRTSQQAAQSKAARMSSRSRDGGRCRRPELLQQPQRLGLDVSTLATHPRAALPLSDSLRIVPG